MSVRLRAKTNADNHVLASFVENHGVGTVLLAAAVHRDAITEACEMKPEIPLLGNDDIAIRHELEFEMPL